MADLTFEIRKPTPYIALIKMEGAIDSQTVVDFQEKFQKLQQDKYKYFILDMGGIKYVNSAGLGTLVTMADALSEQQGGIVLTQLQAKVKVVFDMLHLNSFFKVFSNEQEALKYLDALENKRKSPFPSAGKTGKYPVAQDRSAADLQATRENYLENSATMTPPRSMSTISLHPETAIMPVGAAEFLGTKDKIKGMSSEDLKDLSEIVNLFLKRAPLSNDEIAQVQDVLLEIGKLLLNKLQKDQSLLYESTFNAEYAEIKIKLYGQKKR